jgi:hypothetical protein
LTGSALKEFQERWHLDPKFDISNSESDIFSSDNVVASGISATTRRILFCWKEKKTRKQILTEAIESTSHFSKEKIKKLKGASDIQVGFEIMHLFIIDLLGYVFVDLHSCVCAKYLNSCK